MHPYEEFMLELGDYRECLQHGGMLRLSQSGLIVTDSYHIQNDLHRVQALQKAGFLTYEIKPGHYDHGREDGLALYPTDKTKDAINVYERTDTWALLETLKYRDDTTFGSF